MGWLGKPTRYIIRLAMASGLHKEHVLVEHSRISSERMAFWSRAITKSSAGDPVRQVTLYRKCNPSLRHVDWKLAWLSRVHFGDLRVQAFIYF